MKGNAKRVRMPRKIKVRPAPTETLRAAETGAATLQVHNSRDKPSSAPVVRSLSPNILQDTDEGECRGEDSSEEGPQMFEELCERMLCALGLVQTSLSEVLDVKDELVSQNVPSSIQAQISLSTSKLFRSMLDLQVPSTELVRLVRLYGPQWEQKRQILNQLQGEHERLQRLLSLALRRVQFLETQLQHFRNWEGFSAKLSSTGHADISQMLHRLDLERADGHIANGENKEETNENSSFTELLEDTSHRYQRGTSNIHEEGLLQMGETSRRT
ncbi:uncharacterized protein LOC134578436 [Pelobates fuscus]|uniref:uncharacterized protein LOC134578436 n=1 Tax=Pelobates fuscus TaxID=191477 RepID=UPI002FE4A2B6